MRPALLGNEALPRSTRSIKAVRLLSRNHERETKVALSFNLYHSVSSDEMEALQRVVAAARALDGARGSEGSSQTTRRHENGIDRRSLAELARSLAALDAVRAQRHRRQSGTVAPWLREYLSGKPRP